MLLEVVKRKVREEGQGNGGEGPSTIWLSKCG
jgi:hypothetical protein